MYNGPDISDGRMSFHDVIELDFLLMAVKPEENYREGSG